MNQSENLLKVNPGMEWDQGVPEVCVTNFERTFIGRDRIKRVPWLKKRRGALAFRVEMTGFSWKWHDFPLFTG